MATKQPDLASRRRALAVGIGLATPGLILTRSAQAQPACPTSDAGRAFLEQIGFAANRAEIRFVDLALDEKPDFKAAESEIRERLLAPLREAEKYDLLALVRHDQIVLTRALQKHDVKTTQYDSKAVRPPDEVIAKESMNCWEVFLDVLLETFQIDAKTRDVFWSVLKELKLDALAEQIARAVRARDLPRATMLLRKFLTLLSSPKALALLESKIGKDAFRRMLKTFASRFVPWLGWLVMAGALASSLWENWPRLEKCKV